MIELKQRESPTLDVLGISVPLNGIDRRLPNKLYQGGEFIYHQGGNTVNLFIQHEGLVQVFRTTKEGKVVTVDLIKGRSLLCEDLLSKAPVYSASAQALKPSRISLIDQSFYRRLLTHPQIPELLLKEQAVRMRARADLTELTHLPLARGLAGNIIFMR